MLDRGKLAVLTMFAVAFVAAGFAWWWNYHRGQQCLAFFGKDAALLVRTAEHVELLQLVPDSDAPADRPVDRIQVGQQTYLLHRVTDISQAKGLIHARTSIVDDNSFRWQASPSQRNPADCQPRVQYAVRFTATSRATLAFDFGCQSLWYVEQNKAATLIPKVSQGWESFLTRHAPPPENPN